MANASAVPPPNAPQPQQPVAFQHGDHTHSAQEAAFLAKHAGHEALHAWLLVGMFVLLLAAQVAIVVWKKLSEKTFQQVTLAGLLVLPAVYAVIKGYVRFLVIWAVYIAVAGYFVSRPFLERPLQVKTPRRVYWFFFLCNKALFALAIMGYVLILLDVSLIRSLPLTQLAVHLLFYGLLFGVISRDLACVCADKMAASLGFNSSGTQGMPSRIPDSRICAICSDTLDSITEDSIRIPCGHVFHSFCIRGWRIVGKKECPCCKEKVELGDVFVQPWEKQNVAWSYVLDITRYLIVWNPLIFTIIHFAVRHIDG